MRLLVTRPEPDALKLRERLEELGVDATVEPLLRVTFENCDPVDFEGVQAVIATSRNALRAIRSHPDRRMAHSLPLFAVGKATAKAARALGFETVVTGAGTASELVAHIASVADPANGLLLHLAGDRLAGDLKGQLEEQGFRILQPVVYRTTAVTAFAKDTLEQLATGEIDGVILLSPRTATIYAGLMAKHGLTAIARELVHFCLSEAVASQLAPLGRATIEIAEAPQIEEVLALIEATAAQSNG
jgi:uroporphyrinogen-III synthase